MRIIITAGGVIIKHKRILLCKRSSNEKLFPGYWGCPGGKADNEKDFFLVVRREVKEEVGLDFEPTKEFGVYETELEKAKVVSHVFIGNFSGELNIDKEEVEECRWFTYEETKNLKLSFHYNKVIEDLHNKDLL